MNFEQTIVNDPKKENKGLYPERAFLRVDEEIEKIKKIESGEIKKIELSEVEKEKVLSFEDGLGERLESIENIKVKSNTFYLDYFVTAEGRAEFLNLTGLDITSNTTDEIKNFFLENRKIFSNLEKKTIKRISR